MNAHNSHTNSNIPADFVSRKSANKITKLLRVHDGDEVADYEAFRDAVSKAQRWRAQHALPAENCFRVLMELVTVFPEAVVSFRLKRMKSILAKIRRPGMNYQLGTMDDIGGCRLILTDMEQVSECVGILAERFELKEGNSIKNYIEKPRKSGYRSHHLITVNPGVDRDYRVEVQVRTQLQHLWSTTVEAMSIIYDSDYKAEREADGLSARERQIRTFFTIVSSLFSIEEGMPQVAGYEKTSDELIHDLHELEMLESIVEDLSKVDDNIFLSENGTQFDQAGFYLMRFATGVQFLDIG